MRPFRPGRVATDQLSTRRADLGGFPGVLRTFACFGKGEVAGCSQHVKSDQALRGLQELGSNRRTTSETFVVADGLRRGCAPAAFRIRNTQGPDAAAHPRASCAETCRSDYLAHADPVVRTRADATPIIPRASRIKDFQQADRCKLPTAVSAFDSLEIGRTESGTRKKKIFLLRRDPNPCTCNRVQRVPTTAQRSVSHPRKMAENCLGSKLTADSSLINYCRCKVVREKLPIVRGSGRRCERRP